MTKEEIAQKCGFINGMSIFSNAEVIEQKLYLAMEMYAVQEIKKIYLRKKEKDELQDTEDNK